MNMKKTICLILSLVLLLSAAAVRAEASGSVLDTIAGLEWSFCSGAGAWSTDMRIQADGTFSGEYHDSEMGESDEAYPYGTVYGCSFHGTLSAAEQTDENTWKILISSLQMDEGQVREAIDGGIRYITTEPYGITEGDVMTLYRPGTPLTTLTEEMLIWTHALDMENQAEDLTCWFLYSENNGNGFVSYPMENDVSLANPWVDLTAEQLTTASGLSFGVPEGAQNVIYRYLPGENLAEMQFVLDQDEYCARIRPAALQEGELMNIADMYFVWENEENITIGHCSGTMGLAQTGSEDWAELCLWYDIVPGIMYSLSVYTTDPDGLDLTAVAGQVYIPVQGND